jgi:hydroxyacylglutathione hydrolase
VYLERFYDPGLAQASYLVGCPATGESLVVDPARDPAPYLAAAAREGLRVTHVTETHVHADFVSGARELAARAGARLLLSGEGGAEWRYAYAAPNGGPDPAELLRDGDAFAVGRVRVEARHTPGHTPEHLAFLATDTAAAGQPLGMFTGDFVFAGDVGRPDLLERAAGRAGTAEAGARALFASLRRLDVLPDWLQLWPGHGAGSACGKALGAVPQTTLGYERLVNWALAERDEAAFVRRVLEGQPDPPAYFARVKQVNRDGPPPLAARAPVGRRAGASLADALDAGLLVVDVRAAGAYAAAHVPGTLNVPCGRAFATWAGWLVPAGQPFGLVADGEGALGGALAALAAVGLDDVAGWWDAGDALAALAAAGRAPGRVPQTAAAALAADLAAGRARVLDVRAPAEWAAGRIPGAPNVPLGELGARLDEVRALGAGSPGRPRLVAQCQGGARSAMAASLLRARGLPDVDNLAGGYAEWARAGLPTEPR